MLHSVIRTVVSREDNQKMKIVCAWCGKDMGMKNGESIEGTSHGLCHECLNKLAEKKVEGLSSEAEPHKE